MAKKKGGFRKAGSRGKLPGALIAVGAAAIAFFAGMGASSLANKTVGARGVVKHGAGLAVGGPIGAAGSVADDFVSGKGLDLSLSIPGFGQTAPAQTQGGATF